jgi:hypothetical protein
MFQPVGVPASDQVDHDGDRRVAGVIAVIGPSIQTALLAWLTIRTRSPTTRAPVWLTVGVLLPSPTPIVWALVIG